jgi:riboflavin synthase
MFSGIIEKMGTLLEIVPEGSNKRFRIAAPFATELYVDQSIAHDGVCLTVVSVNPYGYEVVAIPETLNKTTLDRWEIGSVINLERALKPSSLLDGHMVQGHVDTTVSCTSLISLDGSRVLGFNYQPDASAGMLAVQKGSVTLNGISLTVSKAEPDYFEVSVIPHTMQLTNIANIQIGAPVNIEFDIIGKYLARMLKPYLQHLSSDRK